MNEGNQSVLIQLSNGCESHRSAFHDSSHGDNGESEICSKVLASLRTSIIPKVEEKYSPLQRPFASEVGSLCDFYCSALTGHFCPNAPTLFQPNEKDPHDGSKSAQNQFNTLTVDTFLNHYCIVPYSFSSCRKVTATPDSQTSCSEFTQGQSTSRTKTLYDDCSLPHCRESTHPRHPRSQFRFGCRIRSQSDCAE